MKLLGRSPKSSTDSTVDPTVADEAIDGARPGAGRSATASADGERPPSGKGRPTPKRREAEGRRTGPVVAPKTRKEAERLRRSKAKQSRATIAERAKAGDDRYLARRDQGPERAIARDVVDARRNVGSIFIPVAIVVVLSLAIPQPGLRTWATAAWLALFLLIVVDSFSVAARIRRVVKEMLPGSTTPLRGVMFYGAQRATLPRRMRMPKARVGLGDPVGPINPLPTPPR